MLRIYGTAMSRASRALWAAEELGLKYEHVPVGFADGACRKPDYLKINPNGHVPAIDDDGLVLWESMAIDLYLAEKYGKAPFWPSRVEDRARVYQWSFWGMMECEGHLVTALVNRMMRPPEQRDEKAAAAAIEALPKPFAVLEASLAGKDYLLGKDFTIADLNLAGVLILASMLQVDLAPYPAVKAWLDKCLARPALQRARALS